MGRNPSGIAFRPDIQGLRALAVTLVVAFHCGIPLLAGGFVGVDVFFVLSGYLITELLVTELRRTGSINLASFYARRVRRLLPASVLMLLVTLGASAVLFAPQELDFAARAGRASALYLANLFFALDAKDYFAPDVRSNPMLHMWSLAVEEQFYVFWPVILLTTFRCARCRAASASGELQVLVPAAAEGLDEAHRGGQ
ncbi:MAG: acyltransferase [Gammaproteobacteria bacterium]|nr:acyltransferase [Gammaproteobacteria bacterium]